MSIARTDVDEPGPAQLSRDDLIARVDALQREVVFLRARLAERRLVERAKGLLMSHYGLTEDEAYRRLRTEAMNRRERIGDVASRVIAVLHMAGGGKRGSHPPVPPVDDSSGPSDR